MSKEEFLPLVKKMGKLSAEAIQNKANTLNGTELNAEAEFIPDFSKACEKANMLNRPIGFVCKSTEGRVVKLLQNYDSTVYTAEPEKIPAQWGFVWSNNAEHALPFVALSTSPYMTGNVCSEDGVVYRSLIDNNVWKPSEYSQGWEVVSE